jgi:hypothetical protein
MVEAIHIVYASVDKYVYGGINHDACASGDDHDFSLSDLCDVRRYKDYPECVRGFPSKNTPLVKLKRATVGRWMSDYWDSEVDLGEFEDDLADNYPCIHPRFMCRYPGLGPLDRYPSVRGKIEINVLHDPELDKCCDNLVMGALNIVYVGIVPQDAGEGATRFIPSVLDVASSLSDTFKEWDDLHDAQVIKKTFVRFTIKRDKRVSGVLRREFSDLLKATNIYFGAMLDEITGPERNLRSNWDICWADEEGDCPACQPDTCHPAYRTDSICNKDTRLQYEKTTVVEDVDGPGLSREME